MREQFAYSGRDENEKELHFSAKPVFFHPESTEICIRQTNGYNVA